NSGKAPFDEPGLSELLARVVNEHRLAATTDTSTAVAESEVCVVIVPVLLTGEKDADLSVIESATRDVARGLKRGALVAFETTIPVGQTRKLGAVLETGGLRAGIDFDLAFSPERVKSQAVLRNLKVNAKVVGGLTRSGLERASAFYSEYLGAPVIEMESLEAAEFVKLAGMVYRDVNIALANELANYARHIGVDFDAVRAAANTDGEAKILVPGIGVGGHCTPVYPHFLIADADRRGVEVLLAETGREINDAQPVRTLALAGSLSAKRVVILGLGFRPQVKEAAYSPAYALRDEITRQGGLAFVNDPLFSPRELEQLGFRFAPVETGEVIVLNTAHDVFLNLDFDTLRNSGVEVVIDGRSAWNPENVRAAGLQYFGISKGQATSETPAEPVRR
ncbi:MAG TPA: nucleotide sugar dehydrogenase, partial [Gemmatimonadaceae bacterium]|nr:nucleotide sugar dehydrogenase [Gemmatimonadaceae bacterium]